MSSRLAAAAQAGVKQPSKAKAFYSEVCRCMPFIQTMMKLDEVVTLKDMRAVVKEKFKEYKDVKDPRVIDMLIFKGREELEVYLTLHKNRHHAITEYLDPVIKKNTKHTLPEVPQSAFLTDFFQSNSAVLTGK